MTVTRSQEADDQEASDEEVDDRHQPAPAEVLGRRIRRLYVLVTALVLIILFGAIATGVAAWARSSTPSQNSPEVGFARDMYTHHGQAVTMGLLMRNTVPEPMNTLAEDIVTGQAEQQGIMLGWLQDHKVLSADDTWTPMAWMDGTSGMADMSAHGSVAVTAAPTSSSVSSGSTTSASGSSSTPTPTSMVGWGVMPGMATDAELTQLVQLDGKAKQVLFLRLMLRHHRAGTDMARAYLDLGNDPQLRELAQSVVTSQEREITIMTDLLKGLGATETAS